MKWLMGLAVAFLVLWGHLNEKRKAVRVRCDSRGAGISYGRWKENWNDCTRYGSDLLSVDLNGCGHGRGLATF